MVIRSERDMVYERQMSSGLLAYSKPEDIPLFTAPFCIVAGLRARVSHSSKGIDGDTTFSETQSHTREACGCTVLAFG